MPRRLRPTSHPVTWRTLILTSVALLVLLTGLSGAAAWWAWHHLAAQVTLREQPARIRMPRSLAVRAAVDNRVQVKVDQVLPVRVPISQTLAIPLDQPMQVQVKVDTVVPIDLVVPVRHVVRIDQSIALDTTVKTRVLGIPLSLPVQGTVPLKTDVPIVLDLPVKHQLPVSLNAPATVRLSEPLRTRIDTVFEAKVPVRQSLSLPVTAPVEATLSFPGQVVEAGLDVMAVSLPFQAIRIEPRSDRRLSGAAARPSAVAAPLPASR